MYITSNQFQIKGDELTVKVKLASPWLLERYKPKTIGLYIDDGRTITPNQVRKIYALANDIALWEGYTSEDMVQQLKMRFLAYCESPDWFSLSPKSIIASSVENAKNFITYLMDYCLEHDIPLKQPLYENVEDIDAYLYSCMIHKRCAVCGQKCDLHHWDSIGMGRDRIEVVHVGMRAITLCREHHNEAHSIGQQTFQHKYKLYGIKIDETIANLYHLKRSIEL